MILNIITVNISVHFVKRLWGVYTVWLYKQVVFMYYWVSMMYIVNLEYLFCTCLYMCMCCVMIVSDVSICLLEKAECVAFLFDDVSTFTCSSLWIRNRVMHMIMFSLDFSVLHSFTFKDFIDDVCLVIDVNIWFNIVRIFCTRFGVHYSILSFAAAILWKRQKLLHFLVYADNILCC